MAMKTIKIILDYWQKPGPSRAFDWSAVTDNYDGAPDSSTRSQIGYGETKEAAIHDLLELMDDREAAELQAAHADEAARDIPDPDHEWLDDMAFERAHAWGRP